MELMEFGRFSIALSNFPFACVSVGATISLRFDLLSIPIPISKMRSATDFEFVFSIYFMEVSEGASENTNEVKTKSRGCRIAVVPP